MGAHVVNNFLHALQQLGIVQRWICYPNPVATKLAGIAQQAGGVSERAHRHWTIVCGHAAKLALCNQRGLSAEIAGAERGNYAGRSTTDNEDVQHYSGDSTVELSAGSAAACFRRCDRRAIRFT